MAGPYGLAESELKDGEAWFVDRVDQELRPNGYRLIGTFAPGAELAAGVAGFRLIRSNAWGDHLWIEDFITGGLGPESETVQLLSFLEAEARQLGLREIHLDLVTDEPSEDESEAINNTGLAAVHGLDDLPEPADPVFDRKRAALHGFREVASRFILKVDGGDATAPQVQWRGASAERRGTPSPLPTQRMSLEKAMPRYAFDHSRRRLRDYPH